VNKPYNFIPPKAEGSPAEILIYGDLGEDFWAEESVTAKIVVDQLNALPPETPVLVRINSYGGSVSDGLAIYSALKAHAGHVTTRVDGVAMSAATLPAIAGEVREVSHVATLMIHGPWTVLAGNAKDLRGAADSLDIMADSMVPAFSSMDEGLIRSWLFDGEDHFFTAEQALENGFATDIFRGTTAIAAAYRNNRFVNKGEPVMPDNNPSPEEILAAERMRVSSIQRLSVELSAAPEAVSQAIADGVSAEEFELQASRSRIAELQQAAAAPKPAAPKPAPSGAIQGGQAESRIEAISGARHQKLKYFPNEQAAYVAGQFGMAYLGGKQNSADWLYQHTGLDIRGQTITTAGPTGVLIPDELENAIVDLRERYGVLRGAARVVPMGSDTKSRPVKTSGVTAVPMGEASTLTAENANNRWGRSSLIARKWGVLLRYSSELDEDAIIDFAMDLADDIGLAMAEAEDNAGFNGDGTSTYHGIHGIAQKILLAAHSASVVEASGNTYADVTIPDIAKLMSLLRARFHARAQFVCSRVGYAMTLGRLKMAAGGTSKTDLEAMDRRRFLEYPVLQTEKLPNVFTTLAGEVMLLFGDIRAACDLGNRRGLRLVQSNERYIESDELAMLGTERFDINWHSCGDTSEPGPVVALIGKTT
jgi:HK97 family phage major capsid protein